MTIGALNPIDNAQAYDTITLGGVESPGYCKISDIKREHEWDVKKGKGTTGATTTFVQKPPAKFTITFYAWTSDHFIAWDDFLPLLNYDATKKSINAIEIYHPILADINVHSVVVASISGWSNDGKGLWSRSVEFLEYFPASKKSGVSTPGHSDTNADKSSGGKAPGNTPNPAITDAQNQLNNLMNEYNTPS